MTSLGENLIGRHLVGSARAVVNGFWVLRGMKFWVAPEKSTSGKLGAADQRPLHDRREQGIRDCPGRVHLRRKRGA